MIAKKSYDQPKSANLKRVETPFYGLKGNNHESKRPIHAVKKKSPSTIHVPRFSPWKVMLATISIGIVGFLYLTHVFATQEILKEVTDLRRAHETAKRSHAEHSLTYDRKTGPAEIYQIAKTQGFINGGAADPMIRMNK
ncbi:MAG: hypothetical protein WD267_04255 [Balneolales bacterium]